VAEYFLKDLEARQRLEAIEALLDPGTIRLLGAIGTATGGIVLMAQGL
jgi:hypothetical protein